MRRAGAVVAFMTAIAIVAAGCGGGGSSTSSSITKAEFVKKGNAICAAGNKRVESEFEAFAKEVGLEEGEEPTGGQDKDLAEEILLPSVKQEVEEIKALGYPDEEAEAVIESAEESIAEGEKDPAAVVTSANPFKKTNELAHGYGLTVCGEES